jgi:hypothetical protein
VRRRRIGPLAADQQFDAEGGQIGGKRKRNQDARGPALKSPHDRGDRHDKDRPDCWTAQSVDGTHKGAPRVLAKGERR